MEKETRTIKVENNESIPRFEALVEGHLAFIQYRYSDKGHLVLAHTEVPAALGGRGIGSELARAALEFARSRDLRVAVTCPFITSYINRHPEYQSLVHDTDSSRE